MFSIEKIRERCGYSSVNGLREVWQTKVHQDVQFPNKHEPLAEGLLLPLLQYLATPTNGKSQAPINAAKEMLAELGYSVEPGKEKKGIGDEQSVDLSPSPLQRNTLVPESKTPKEKDGNSEQRVRKETVSRSLKEISPKKKWPVWVQETFGDFALVDLVTYFSIGIFGASSVGIFGYIIGPFFWGIFTTIILNALRIVKTRRLRDAAGTAIFFVFMAESVGGLLEYSFIYMTLKESVPELPWGTEDSIYNLVAMISAVLIAFFSGFAIYMRYQMTQAIINSVDFKRAHGEEY